MKNKFRRIAIIVCLVGLSQSARAGEVVTDITPEGTYHEPQRVERLVPDPEKFEDLGQVEDEFQREVDKTDLETKTEIRKIEKRISEKDK